MATGHPGQPSSRDRLLHLALGALTAAGPPPGLREIVQLRFRRQLLPGEEMVLEVKGIDPGGRYRFEASRTGQLVANCIVILGDGPPDAPLAALVRQSARAAAPSDLEALLPHRPHAIRRAGRGGVRRGGVSCVVSVGAQRPRRRRVRAVARALEMAQSAAVFGHGRLARVRDAPPSGYWSVARDVRSRLPNSRGGTAVGQVRLSWASPPLSTYGSTSRRGGGRVWTAERLAHSHRRLKQYTDAARCEMAHSTSAATLHRVGGSAARFAVAPEIGGRKTAR